MACGFGLWLHCIPERKERWSYFLRNFYFCPESGKVRAAGNGNGRGEARLPSFPGSKLPSFGVIIARNETVRSVRPSLRPSVLLSVYLLSMSVCMGGRSNSSERSRPRFPAETGVLSRSSPGLKMLVYDSVILVPQKTSFDVIKSSLSGNSICPPSG